MSYFDVALIWMVYWFGFRQCISDETGLNVTFALTWPVSIPVCAAVLSLRVLFPAKGHL